MIDFFSHINFVHPYFLSLLLLVPLLVFWYIRQLTKRYASMRMPAMDNFSASSIRGRLQVILPILRALAFIALVIALARPQKSLREEDIKAEGIDIMMAIDLSSSMLAQDFDPNRLEASKRVGRDFIAKRAYDRVGLVVFAGEAFTQCPLTTDHDVVQQFLASLECGILEDGTAIGMGLATAVNRIKDSPVKSKIVILLTDGVNNTGYVAPLQAAQVAQEFGVKVYTIGVGSTGQTMAPSARRRDGRYVFNMVRVEIDEALLTQIAQMTGGKYYRATDEASLINIYDTIDQLEKTEIDVTVIKRYSEEFYWFVIIGLIFLALEVFLRYTVLRTIP
ncbi:MAG: VWA domain-containing protein [Saprospiraceae bacterium]|nr:VWA domain-containing protein [Saprospiraceae bacterium]MCB9325066.1 VWA domain-containing protein [Lewinellaceae bacterium]